CEALGISDRVVFHGALYDRNTKASLFLNSHLGILPGRGGLAIQELMAYGIPVASGLADGTERDLIANHSNGYLVDEFLTEERIAAVIRDFVRLPTTDKIAMALRAFETIEQQQNVEAMAHGFVEAIMATAQGHSLNPAVERAP